MRLLLRTGLAALLCALANPAAAQQRAFEVAEVEELLRGHVASSRILLLVQQRCIAFEPTKEVLLRLAAAGATDELLEGLLAPGQCRKTAAGEKAPSAAPPSPEPPSPAPPAAPRPRPAEEPPAPARTRGLPLFFAGIGYSAGSFRGEGGPTESGHGAAGEIGVGGAHFAVFARGAYADVDAPDGEEDYSLGHGDVGLRLMLFPARAPLRPYIEAAFAVIAREYADDQGDAFRTVSGTGGAGGAGLRLTLSRKLELDASYRAVLGSLTQVDEDGATERLDDPVRGRGNWWSVGVNWTPGR